MLPFSSIFIYKIQIRTTFVKFEETGLNVEVEHLIGVYSKYSGEFPNGDKAQTITHCFQCKPIGGELTVDGIETLDLKYFPIDQTT